MADFDSTDLLARLKATLQIESNTADASDALLYTLLSNGQRRMAQIIAAVAPDVNMLVLETLTSSDSGETYALTYYPLSNLELYDGDPNGIPIPPANYGANQWDGYVLEGKTIRWPGGRTRTFSNGLYARYNRVPAAISASSEPSLKPEDARQGIVYAAAEEFAMQGGAMDPGPYATLLRRFLYGDREIPGDLGLIGRVQTSSRLRKRPVSQTSAPWWRGPDLT